MPWGVSSEGFNQPSLDEIKTELEDAFKAAFGESIDINPQSNFGQLIGILAEREADLWALGQAVWSAFTPDGATGVSLDELCGITGTIREPATPSTVTITATGTNATVLPVGRVVSVASIGTRFVTLAEGTLASLTAWAPSTAYTVGARRSNASRSYVCTVGGTSAGSGGPTTTASAITDGTVTWRYMGEGTAAVDIACESEDTGPKTATSGTLTVIETPVSGWSSVINLLDATLGTNLETDAALRLRREAELRATGNASLEAIRADVLQVEDVISCTVFENPDDATDGDGLPPHSIEVLARGGTDAAVAAAIFGTVAAGIQTYGTTTETVTDSQGIDHDISFTRPSEQTVYVTINLTIDEDVYPADGDDQVKAAIVAWGDAQDTGRDVVSSVISAQAISNVPGILDSTALIKLTPGPTLTTTIVITSRQLAVYDTSRISVVTTPGTP